MTTLTRELSNKQSALYKWFDFRHNTAGDRIIQHHNSILQQKPKLALTSYPNDYNFLLLGTAVIYALRLKMGWLSADNSNSVASLNITEEINQKLISAKTNKEIAVASLFLAVFEQRYRTGSFHPFEGLLLAAIKKNQLTFTHDVISCMLVDLYTLLDSLPFVWADSSDLVTKIPASTIYLNATFPDAPFNADAQQIVNGVLIKCFTTLKSRPFTKYHFWQQIAYALLDEDNQYNITHICWYYSRQQCLFIHPIETLFKSINQTRLEFSDYLLNYYDDDVVFLGRPTTPEWCNPQY